MKEYKNRDINKMDYRNNMSWAWPETIIGCFLGILLGLLIALHDISFITPSLIILPLSFIFIGILFQKYVQISNFIGGWAFGFSLTASIILYNKILPISVDILLASFYMLACVGTGNIIIILLNIIANKLKIFD